MGGLIYYQSATGNINGNVIGNVARSPAGNPAGIAVQVWESSCRELAMSPIIPQYCWQCELEEQIGAESA